MAKPVYQRKAIALSKMFFLPALCASKHNADMKVSYARLIERKPAKKIGIIAVARKLLILMYTLRKNDTEFKAATIEQTAA